MDWDHVQQYIRIGLYKLAGVLVGAGYVQASEVEIVVGASLAVTNLFWTFYWNRQRKDG